MADARRIARVLIDSALPQLDRLFDYSIPEALAEDARPGVRVRVPLRNAIAGGYLIELSQEEQFEGALLPLEEVVSPLPVLDAQVYALARRLADRAAGTASDVLRLAIPKRQVRVERAELARYGAEARQPHWPEQPSAEQDAFAQDVALPAATGIPGYPAALAAQLAAGERIALEAVAHPVRLATRDGAGEGEGSGTVPGWCVTAAAIARQFAVAGGGVILAVPDYRDLDALEEALAAGGLAAMVARVDAAQSGAERYRAFLAARSGRARIVIGNRAALLAPVQQLAAILLWDDGDPLHAEPHAPYQHARDVALVRQELSGAALILAGHTRSVEVQRLVEIGWLRPVSAEPRYRPRVVLTQRIDEAPGQARVPAAAWAGLQEALEHGPVLVQVARPSGQEDAPGAPDVLRTAQELGKAFPRVRVLSSHGQAPLTGLAADPAIVVATRGAEPIPEGGYRAVLLLDGARMLARESLRAAEDCLRWWSNAAALAAPKAPVYLTGVSGSIAEAFAVWNQSGFAAAELADRRSLRFAPAVRTVGIEGPVGQVQEAVDELRQRFGAEEFAPRSRDGAKLRAVLRFEYRYGGEVAQALRAAVIRNATGRRRPASKAPLPLRVRFDEREPFEE